MHRVSLAVALALVFGCAEPAETALQESEGVAGEASCAPGSKPVDGDCLEAGVDPEHCASGFESDDEGGCVPVLPENPCPPGTMALPGEQACRPVSDCGSDVWGNIVDTPDTQYVDPRYAGDDSDGSRSRPWNRVDDALAAASPGATVALAEGSYSGSVIIIDKPIEIRGRCPDRVELVVDEFGIVVGDPNGVANVDGTAIRDLAVTGTGLGIIASNVRDLALERIWIHDLDEGGVLVGDNWGVASAVITDSLIERFYGLGVGVMSSEVEIVRTVVRDGASGGLGDGRGIGLEIFEQPGAALVRDAVIERNHGVGLGVVGRPVIVEAVVVRDTKPMADGSQGLGIAVTQYGEGVRGELTLRQSFVASNHGQGILVQGSDAIVQHTVLRDTALGAGAWVQYGLDLLGGDLSLEGCLVTSNHTAGVAAVGGHVTLESTLVRNTSPNAAGEFGLGIYVGIDAKLPPAQSPIASSEIRWSRVEQSYVAGLSVVGGEVTVSDSHVFESRANDQGAFGDGVFALASKQVLTNIVVDRSRIEASSRAGIANFAASVKLSDTTLECNTIHLDGESGPAGPYTFEDGGGNICGCESESVVCKIYESSLQPPTQVGP